MTDPSAHDTDRAPAPPEETMNEAKLARAEMTTDQKLDAILDRLEEGDREFLELRADFGIIASSVKALCDVRGLDDHVQALGQRLAERFPVANGAGHDEPTNPEHDRPDPEPS